MFTDGDMLDINHMFETYAGGDRYEAAIEKWVALRRRARRENRRFYLQRSDVRKRRSQLQVAYQKTEHGRAARRAYWTTDSFRAKTRARYAEKRKDVVRAPRAAPAPKYGPKAITDHGKRRAYNMGCRCDRCIAVTHEYNAKRYDTKRPGLREGDWYGPKALPGHGKRSSYLMGCRCDLCRAAKAEEHAKRKARARAR
jgi:hypothetical protein